jgi:transcriptional regulator with XRE-family HTH domain
MPAGARRHRSFAGAGWTATIMALFTLVTKQPADGEQPSDDNALTVLRRRLELAHREAGRPTYRVISKESGLSASTICRIFKARKTPARDNLELLLKALGIAPDEIKNTWYQLWLNAENDCDPIAVTFDDGLVAPGREHCETCGVWLADPGAHIALHQRLGLLDTVFSDDVDVVAELLAVDLPHVGT